MEALEWVQVLVTRASGVQNVKDLHVSVGLEDDKEHLALVSEVKDIVVGGTGRVSIKPRLVNKERVILVPVEVLVHEREKFVCIVVKTEHGSALEECYHENAQFEVFTAHVCCDCLSSRVVIGSPSLNHVVVAALGILTNNARDSDREVDEID